MLARVFARFLPSEHARTACKNTMHAAVVGASMLAASGDPVQHIFTTSKGRVITCVDQVGWTNGGDLDCQT